VPVPANIRLIFLPPIQPRICDLVIKESLQPERHTAGSFTVKVWLVAHPTPESRLLPPAGGQKTFQYNPDVITEFQTVLQAWSKVSTETIWRCWNKAQLRLEGPVEPFRLANGNTHYELGQVYESIPSLTACYAIHSIPQSTRLTTFCSPSG